jgi:hypothetical protein
LFIFVDDQKYSINILLDFLISPDKYSDLFMNVKYLHGIYYLCIAHSDVHQDLDGSDIVSDRLFFVFTLVGLVYVYLICDKGNCLSQIAALPVQ